MNSPLYRRAVLIFASLAVVLGFAILIRTSTAGGGSVGYIIGCMFIVLGAARLYLLKKT